MTNIIAALLIYALAVYQIADRRRLLRRASAQWEVGRSIFSYLQKAPDRVFALVFTVGVIVEIVFATVLLLTALR